MVIANQLAVIASSVELHTLTHSRTQAGEPVGPSDTDTSAQDRSRNIVEVVCRELERRGPNPVLFRDRTNASRSPERRSSWHPACYCASGRGSTVQRLSFSSRSGWCHGKEVSI